MIIGQDHIIDMVLSCFLARGHLLITGVPGLGKTRLIKAFAQNLNLSFGRIQYTPDLLPSDISGCEILNQSIDQKTKEIRRSFEFVKGPIFNNLVLADEINRASPRTQSAMLEAMQERTLTYGLNSYKLPDPFMVCATQNPLENEGTYPLPEAQLDRFLMSVEMDYPDSEDELELLKKFCQQKIKDFDIKPNSHGLCHKDINDIISYVDAIKISQDQLNVINSLVRLSRDSFKVSQCKKAHKAKNLEKFSQLIKKDKDNDYDDINNSNLTYFKVRYGSGPRGALSLISACKALAFIQKEEYVRYRHIKKLAVPVLSHRIGLFAVSFGSSYNSTSEFINTLLNHLENEYNLLNE